MLKLLNIFFIFLIFSSCDFTSILQKDLLRAQLAVNAGEYTKASQIYNDILKKSFKRSIRRKILYQQGEIHLVYLQQPKKALDFFEKIFDGENDPYWQVVSLEKMGEINFSYLKNYEKSLNYYNILMNYSPSLERSDFYQFRLALNLKELKKYPESAIVFEKIAEDKKHLYYSKSFFQIGIINFYEKKWSNAIVQFKKFISVDTDIDEIIQAKFLIANSYETLEKIPEAYNIYYSLLDQYPNPEVIKGRLKSLYERRIVRKR